MLRVDDAALNGHFEFDVKVLYTLTWAQWRAELTEFSADLRVADVFLINPGKGQVVFDQPIHGPTDKVP